MTWKTQRAADRAARAHLVACDHCGTTVASTMKRGPPRGWLADSSRQVSEAMGDGYSVSRAARFCSKPCLAAGPRAAVVNGA